MSHEPTSPSNNGSADQVGWAELAADLREALRKRIKYLDTMDPHQALQLVNALQACYWLEVNAQTFDDHVARETNPGYER